MHGLSSSVPITVWRKNNKHQFDDKPFKIIPFVFVVFMITNLGYLECCHFIPGATVWPIQAELIEVKALASCGP